MREITDEQAGALEENLKTNTDNLGAHEKLIRYYVRKSLSSQDPKIEEQRDEHIFWLIEPHPKRNWPALRKPISSRSVLRAVPNDIDTESNFGWSRR
jgi:hypothetical protein